MKLDDFYYLDLFVCYLMAYQLSGYLMPNPYFQKNSSGAILIHRWEDNGVHTFPKGICPTGVGSISCMVGKEKTNTG